MPRKSPFHVNLSSEERQTLESMARKYTSPYCYLIRAKIILLANEGLSNDVIASRLDTPRRIVSKYGSEKGPHARRLLILAGTRTAPACLSVFQSHYERPAPPFNWTFARPDLHALLAK